MLECRRRMQTFTSTDGYRIAFDVTGRGPAIVLHLGAGCDANLWPEAGYLEPLARHYQCLLIDHRGHGQSDKPRGGKAHHFDRYVDDVVTMLDHLNIERTAFWGYSTGISVGIRFGERFPDRLTALIGSGAMTDDDPESMNDWAMSMVPLLREEGWAPLLRGFDGEEATVAVPPWMREWIAATDIENFIGWLEGMPEWDWWEWDALLKLDVPTLLIAGELEDPDDSNGRAVSAMARARRARVPARGHINAFLASDVVLPHVLQFLSTLVSS